MTTVSTAVLSDAVENGAIIVLDEDDETAPVRLTRPLTPSQQAAADAILASGFSKVGQLRRRNKPYGPARLQARSSDGTLFRFWIGPTGLVRSHAISE